MGTVQVSSSMAMDISTADKERGLIDSPEELDAGALFVLQSRGSWVHCGYHLTTSIVGPVIFSLPFALALLGQTSASLQRHGHTHFRTWMGHVFCRTTSICNMLWCSYWMYSSWRAEPQVHLLAVPTEGEDAAVPIHNNILNSASNSSSNAIFSLSKAYQPRLLASLSRLQHLRYCWFHLHRKIQGWAPFRDYSMNGSQLNKVFGAFNGISIISTTFASGIIPEIQATIAAPVKGKMFKGLCMCYGVIICTFFSVAISGYWAFGNQSKGTILYNFMGDEKPLLPTWFLLMTNIFTLMQLIAITLVIFTCSFLACSFSLSLSVSLSLSLKDSNFFCSPCDQFGL
ncbi:hypothetical protein LWI29_022094 [Acer saccharum]|uniref:Amino acid transporter transmembrane domain-containing protein n=1 Tax=Acer saccharum TaxID=4024 RepID=A0AA39VW08_ACESA|nr:hypothetical protein LWI29_022094 [Acer saccharum]